MHARIDDGVMRGAREKNACACWPFAKKEQELGACGMAVNANVGTETSHIERRELISATAIKTVLLVFMLATLIMPYIKERREYLLKMWLA